MKRFLLSALFSFCAFFPLVAATSQEISTPMADGSNTSLTVKPRLVLMRVELDRNGNAIFWYARVKLNSADDSQIGEASAWIQVSRPLTPANLADTVTQGGQPVTLQTAITVIGKFGDKYWAADHP